MKELIGKTIKQIFLDSEKVFLKFVTDEEEEIYYRAVGDCCSESWFHESDGIHSLIGNEFIQSAESFLANYWSKHYDGANIKSYCIKINSRETSKFGYETEYSCTITYRNSSNGYYGGECSYVSKERIDEFWPDLDFKEVSEDFEGV